MKIGYAIMLNNECHNFIRKVQLELYQHIGIGLARQAPHITIKSPFDTSEIEPHIQFLEATAQTLDPFKIRFDGFSSFGKSVIFLNIAENDRLNQLHFDILAEMKKKFDLDPHEFEGKNVKFHASIAAFNSEGQYEKGMEYLSKYNPTFEFTVDTFGLFYYLGEGNGWIVNRKIDFR